MKGTSTIATAIKERGIIFGAESVRAILGGFKTVTRRVIKPQPPPRSNLKYFDDEKAIFCYGEHHRSDGCEEDQIAKCPLGRVGDRLWVREAWGDVTRAFQGHDCEEPQVIAFRADEGVYNVDGEVPIYLEKMDDSGIVCSDWKSPIHMPRWASRLTLEIVSVRAERLQAITEEDAKAEGLIFRKPNFESIYEGFYGMSHWPHVRWLSKAREAFIEAWGEINGKRKGCDWDSNPFTWRIEFKRIADG